MANGFGAPKKKRGGEFEKPKSIKEMPSYLSKQIKGFTSRFFYIISLVWETSPAILIVMSLLCILDGIFPIIGAYITKELLNGIQALIGQTATGNIAEDVFTTLRPILFLLILQFLYILFNRTVQRIHIGVTAIAGELVVNHIKLKIINKAKTVDMGSFDNPAFYEKLENANREAGARPIAILSATFRLISDLISVVSFIVVLATLSVWAPVIIICAALPGAVLNYAYRKKNFTYMRRHSKDRREMNYYSEMLVNKDLVKEVKILGLGENFTGRYKNAFT